MKTVLLRVFIAGILTNIALRSLFADSLGKEKYVESVRQGWMPEAITVPFALFILLIATALLLRAYFQTFYLGTFLAQAVYRAAYIANQDRITARPRGKGLTQAEMLMDAVQPWVTHEGKSSAEWDAFYATLPKKKK